MPPSRSEAGPCPLKMPGDAFAVGNSPLCAPPRTDQEVSSIHGVFQKKGKADIGVFLKQYARKRQRHACDPNDRDYDRKIERIIRKMDPEELARLLEQEESGDGPDAREKN